MRHPLRLLTRLCIPAVLLTLTFPASAQPDGRATNALEGSHADLIVYHPPTEPPTYIDLGAPGDSVGDVRIFHFDAETEDGSPVVTEWIMTTTGIDTAGPGAESRVTLGVFSFTGYDLDQVLIEGVGLYPSESNTFVPDSMLTRAIIGGTGRFKGASGQLISVHLDDDSWMHIFDFTNNAGRGQR